MAERKKESWLDIIGKGTTAYVKAKTSQKQAELKMGSQLMLKKIENRMDPTYQIKKSMAQQYQQQQGGDRGGEIVAEGSPKDVIKVKESYTGQYLSKSMSV